MPDGDGEYGHCMYCLTDRGQVARLLSCLHNVCDECVRRLIISSIEDSKVKGNGLQSVSGPDSVTILCYLCQTRTQLPRSIAGTDSLPRNHVLMRKWLQNRLSPVVNANGIAGSSHAARNASQTQLQRIVCDECDTDTTDGPGDADDEVTAVCYDCSHVMCDDHVRVHRKSRRTAKHDIRELVVGLGSPGWKQSQLTAVSENKVTEMTHPSVCTHHAKEECVFFCTSCKDGFCKQCTGLHGDGHDVQDLTDVFIANLMADVSLQVTRARERAGELEESLEEIACAGDAIRTKTEEVSADISEHFRQLKDNILSALDAQEKSLLMDVDTYRWSGQRLLEQVQTSLLKHAGELKQIEYLFCETQHISGQVERASMLSQLAAVSMGPMRLDDVFPKPPDFEFSIAVQWDVPVDFSILGPGKHVGILHAVSKATEPDHADVSAASVTEPSLVKIPALATKLSPSAPSSLNGQAQSFHPTRLNADGMRQLQPVAPSEHTTTAGFMCLPQTASGVAVAETELGRWLHNVHNVSPCYPAPDTMHWIRSPARGNFSGLLPTPGSMQHPPPHMVLPPAMQSQTMPTSPRAYPPLSDVIPTPMPISHPEMARMSLPPMGIQPLTPSSATTAAAAVLASVRLPAAAPVVATSPPPRYKSGSAARAISSDDITVLGNDVTAGMNMEQYLTSVSVLKGALAVESPGRLKDLAANSSIAAVQAVKDENVAASQAQDVPEKPADAVHVARDIIELINIEDAKTPEDQFHLVDKVDVCRSLSASLVKADAHSAQRRAPVLHTLEFSVDRCGALADISMCVPDMQGLHPAEAMVVVFREGTAQPCLVLSRVTPLKTEKKGSKGSDFVKLDFALPARAGTFLLNVDLLSFSYRLILPPPLFLFADACHHNTVSSEDGYELRVLDKRSAGAATCTSVLEPRSGQTSADWLLAHHCYDQSELSSACGVIRSKVMSADIEDGWRKLHSGLVVTEDGTIVHSCRVGYEAEEKTTFDNGKPAFQWPHGSVLRFNVKKNSPKEPYGHRVTVGCTSKLGSANLNSRPENIRPYFFLAPGSSFTLLPPY